MSRPYSQLLAVSKWQDNPEHFRWELRTPRNGMVLGWVCKLACKGNDAQVMDETQAQWIREAKDEEKNYDLEFAREENG